jgi:cytochrome c oxidase subunit 2
VNVPTLERRIVIVSTAFVLCLFGLAALAINLFHVGLPTCLTDIKPFEKGELITHSPTHYELHYVAKMWEFEPKEVTVPAGSTVDVYVSTPDVTHGLILVGTNLNLMVVPGVVNYARVKFDQPRNYQLLCHEYCGTGHERMAATLRVVDPASFQPKQSAPAPAEQTDPTYKLSLGGWVRRNRPDLQRNVWSNHQTNEWNNLDRRRCVSARIDSGSGSEIGRRLR